MKKWLIIIPLIGTLLILTAFSFFAAFNYCDDSKADKMFLCSLGIFSGLMTVFIAIGLITSM